MIRHLRSAFLLLFLPAVLASCVVVPQDKMSDGSPTPQKHLESLIRDGTVVPGKSQARAVGQRLISSSTTRLGFDLDAPCLCQDDSTRQLAVFYGQPQKAYGLTLNSSFFFLPMPMFGANWDSRFVAIFFDYDMSGTLTDWHISADPKLSDFKDVTTRPADAS